MATIHPLRNLDLALGAGGTGVDHDDLRLAELVLHPEDDELGLQRVERVEPGGAVP